MHLVSYIHREHSLQPVIWCGWPTSLHITV